ncbi:MAG: zinc-binding dehydrogenase [Thermaerobacter sp.]|nr:zinc-binding dehydrogenase [Thermaerobacter sp.]
MTGFTGLRFHLALPRVGLQKTVPRLARRVAAGAVRLERLPYPTLPDGEWIELAPLLAGICGSDLGVLSGSSSPYLAPLSSFPAVLGHEVVAQVVSNSQPSWPQGTRVVVKPEISCHTWGTELCTRCAANDHDNCHGRTDAVHGAGLLMGYHRVLPGGWGTRMWAPPRQLYAIPPDMPLQRAVLTEPMAIVVHALRQVSWEAVGTVLVIGAGTIGLLSTLLLGSRYPGRDVWVRAKHPHQAKWVAMLGAQTVEDAGHWTRADSLVRYTGVPLPTILGSPAWRPEGFDLVVDAVGTSQSVAAALTLTKPGGQVLLLGGAGIMHGVDLTPLWIRNLRWIGTYGYGTETDAFSEAIQILQASSLPVESLVTHSFRLANYREALRALWHRRSGAIKVVFEPTPPGDLTQSP